MIGLSPRKKEIALPTEGEIRAMRNDEVSELGGHAGMRSKSGCGENRIRVTSPHQHRETVGGFE